MNTSEKHVSNIDPYVRSTEQLRASGINLRTSAAGCSEKRHFEQIALIARKIKSIPCAYKNSGNKIKIPHARATLYL